MNPVQQEILRRLDAFPEGLAVLRDRALPLHGIGSIRKSGEVLGEWADLRAPLADELDAAARRSAEETPADWWH